MERLSLQELMLATGGRLQNVDSPETSFDRVCIDSRDIRNGDVFWAIKGERFDGHDFIPQAIERQACLCVASAVHSSAVHGPSLIVEETRVALARFAKWYRDRVDTLVIGVTGSVGKTTTRELIYAALGSQFQGTRSQLNFNNEIGLPLSLLNLAQRHEFAVLEMGASAVGDIHRLCELADPEVGVVTAIGPAHLQTFGSMNAIINTKGELLEHLPSTGFAVLPGDDAVLRQVADRAPCPVIFVGQGDDNQIRATRLDVGTTSLRFRCEGDDFEIPVSGRHSLSNALCAIAIGLEVGIPIHRLSAGLANFVPVPGRCHVVPVGSWTVIDDTYNASPLAVAAACHLLSELPDSGLGQRLLVLGDMRELGEIAPHEHEQIGQLAAQLKIDRLLVCGDHANDVVRGAQRCGMKSHQIAAALEAETLLTVLDCWLEPGDVLLIKGSRATRMERVIEWLKARAIQEEDQRRNERPRFCA